MPYVPPHIRNKSAAAVDTDRASVTSGSSGGGYVPPHIRNKKAAEAMPQDDDGPKFEIYTSEITEVVQAPKKAGYVPPSMRKNEPVVVKKKATALTEDDFPDLGATKTAAVTSKSVAWGKKPEVLVAPIVMDASKNAFALLAESKAEEVMPKIDPGNKWSKKLDVTAKAVEQEVTQDDGSCIRLTYEGAVAWWLQYASRPVYVPLEDRDYISDYSNYTDVPHSGMRRADAYHYYDDYAIHINSDELPYEEEEYYDEVEV